MPQQWMKFICENCNNENWLFEDYDLLKKQEVIIFCSICGYVRGQPEKLERYNEKSCVLICIPFPSFERKQTIGPVNLINGKVSPETRWGTTDGGQGLTRHAYMKKYGFDPWTDWCSRHPKADICQDDGFGHSYKGRPKRRI